MTRYLRTKKDGSYLFQRRVPKDLRHRYGGQNVERFIGRVTAAEARRQAALINGELESDFAAMRKGEAVTDAQIERITLAVQRRTFERLKSDPAFAPKELEDEFEQLMPNIEADARAALLAVGVDPNERNIGKATNAVYLGTLAGQALYEKGVEPPAVDTAAVDGPTILEAAQAYQDAPDVATIPKTRRQLLSSAKLFADHVGRDKPVALITGKDAVAFLDRLAKISPEYRRDPRAGEQSLAEIEAGYPAKEGRGLSAATLNRHAMHLRVLINWLIGRHELPEEHRNPFDKKSRKVRAVGYEPATDGEIAALLDSAPLAARFGRNFNECVGWLIMLAAYTGARAGELCALTKDDVREKDGVHYLAITEGKTEAARRVVPLHPELIKAGFVEYAATCKGPLFGVTAKVLATRFPPYRRSRGVDRASVTYHSLRKSFVTSLEEAEVPSDTVALLVGHNSRRSFTFSEYSPHGPSLRTLAKAVAKVAYAFSK